MLPLALYLSQSGHEVSAEDDSFSNSALALLENGGVKVQPFASEDEIALVHSSAILEKHPARLAVEQKGGVVLRRGECLALVANTKRLVAISGSHGKTTACGMLIDILDTLGVGFDYLLGAQFTDKSPSRCSDSEWLVAEIDESDGTIDLFDPEISVILNVDHDHHSKYPTEAAYLAAFEGLARRTRSCVIADAKRKNQLSGTSANTQLFVGEEGDVAVSHRPAGPSWTEVTISGDANDQRIQINRTGKMNAIDAAYAFLAAEAMGGDVSRLSFVELSSIKRRQRCFYNSSSVQVFEDYAHHPAELSAAREAFGARKGWKTIVVFQAHRYSRTKELKAELAHALSDCEELVLLDVYPASETPLEGGMGTDLLQACSQTGVRVTFCEEVELAVGHLLERATEAKTRILFLGAGTGDVVADNLSAQLARRDARWGAMSRELAKVSGIETAVHENEPLATKTTMRVGGPAERYFEPESIEQLKVVVKACRSSNLPLYPLGRGSNLVIPDEGVSGLVIRLSHPYWSRFELLGEGRARLGAGMRIKALCGQAAKEGLEGFEFLEGIPGSLGGVLRMNAGAMGGWVFDVVESIRYLSPEGDVVEAGKEDLEVGYRFCKELESAIALDAVFVSKTGKAAREDIRRTIDTYQSKRKETQPREPSAGCIFKNPEGDAAGKIVQELGLKGTIVGGAEVSHTHGNFIINRGGAKSRDVIELVKFVRKVAKERRGVDLHPEVLLFGSSWEEALR